MALSTVPLPSSSSASLSSGSSVSSGSSAGSSVDSGTGRHAFTPQQIRDLGIEVPAFVKELVIHTPSEETANIKQILSVAVKTINYQCFRGQFPNEVHIRDIIKKGIRIFIVTAEQRMDLMDLWQRSFQFAHPKSIDIAKPSSSITPIEGFSPFVLDEDDLKSFFQLGEPTVEGFSKLTIYIPDSRVGTWNNQEKIRKALRPIIVAALATRQIGPQYEREIEVHVNESSSLTIRGTTPTSSSTSSASPLLVTVEPSSGSFSSSSVPPPPETHLITNGEIIEYGFMKSIQEVLGRCTLENHGKIRKEFDSLEIDRKYTRGEEKSNTKKIVLALVKLADFKLDKKPPHYQALEDITELNINFCAKNIEGVETFTLASCKAELARMSAAFTYRVAAHHPRRTPKS